MKQDTKLQKLQQKLGYIFNNVDLLIEALTHPSIKQNDKSTEDYERLELLGDAVLNFIITEYIFHHFVDYNEGQLAKMRSSLVCKDAICQVAEMIDLDEYIIMTKGEEYSGGRDNPNNLENSMEAIIAAIYLDGGMEVATKIVLGIWDDFLSGKKVMIQDPKTTLQEWSQENSFGLPKYELISKDGYDHAPVFKVKVSVGNLPPQYGINKSIKRAEKNAAQEMLNTVLKAR
jgi:ribonuclease-3